MLWLPAILILPYIIILIKIYINLLKVKAFNVSSDPETFVSVVVACRNEQNNLTFLLNSIAGQDYPKNSFEVIIVDDNSTDKTFEIASGFKGIENIIVINNNGNGKKQAIRSGINASSGILIITTDADCTMGKKWIKTIAAFYEMHKPGMIICPVQIEPKTGFFGKFQELEFLSLQGITAGSALAGEGTMCNGANLSFTKEAYLYNADNLHDEIGSGDDIFLLHSIKKGNQQEILWMESSDSVVTTASSPTFISFLKQRRRWVSKVKVYDDGFTIILGIVTFVTIITLVSVLVAGLINPLYIKVLIAIFLLKSIPDFLILKNTCGRYGKRKLLRWFIPSQIVYPFYVLGVILYSLMSLGKTEN
jgi:poly-beta-1,6-N-acetyl-D-glucosamine synthase